MKIQKINSNNYQDKSNKSPQFKANMYTTIKDIKCPNHICDKATSKLANIASLDGVESNLIKYENIDARHSVETNGMDEDGDFLHTIRVYLLDKTTKLGKMLTNNEHKMKDEDLHKFWNDFVNDKETVHTNLNVNDRMYCPDPFCKLGLKADDEGKF